MHVNQQIKRAPLTGTFRQTPSVASVAPPPDTLLPPATLHYVTYYTPHTARIRSTLQHFDNYKHLLHSDVVQGAGQPPPPRLEIPYSGIAYFYYPDSPDKTATATKVRRQFAHKHRETTQKHEKEKK